MIRTLQATIPINTALSNALSIDGDVLCEIQMPATWTTAHVTFQTSPDGVNFQDLVDTSNAEVDLTVTQAKNRRVNPDLYHGIVYLRLRSGTTATPVNQAAARVLTLVFEDRPYPF